MARKAIGVTFLLVIIAGCGNSVVTQPVHVGTGPANSMDGFQAAMDAAKAAGYSVLNGDPKQGSLRVGLLTSKTVTFDIKAWNGLVDVRVNLPQGLVFDDSEIRGVLGQRAELAQAISIRARIIAGEPYGPVKDEYLSIFRPMSPMPTTHAPLPQ